SLAGTIAVLVLSPRPPGDRLRSAAARLTAALADQLTTALSGEVRPEHRAATIDAKHELMAAFTATPYRPTGLATTDLALESLVGLLEWCAAVVNDSLSEYSNLCAADKLERELLGASADVLRDTAAMLLGEHRRPDLDRLNRALAESIQHLRD